MALKNLLEKKLQFILFGGKGGVGKTTMAAVSAIKFAQKQKTLIFTTDPAPSLGDSFGQTLSNEPQAVKGVKNLYALEINAQQVLKEFRQEYGEDILDILQKGTYLAPEEVEEIFSLD
ncbi:arsenic-transporting ATPase, partial [Patescibacteria group bacterium]|nr:arsenic-transporting ATPase [Patescibacteria group bacterium]